MHADIQEEIHTAFERADLVYQQRLAADPEAVRREEMLLGLAVSAHCERIRQGERQAQAREHRIGRRYR